MGKRSSSTPDRTRGIEVHKVKNCKIIMSIWDMAGQSEFHAFHDLMFPDPSSSLSSPAMFMFVWSPVHSKTQSDGEHKLEDSFRDSFLYWLKFIASKTRQSNAARKVIVVLTRKDQMDIVGAALQRHITNLSEKFKEIVEIVDVLEVDARSTSSVKIVVSCIFETATRVLEGAETYDICRNMTKYLSFSRHILHRKEFKDQPIMNWSDFEWLCEDRFQISDKNVQRGIASSLNESGDLIYLSNMLVLDPNWFCREIMGNLVHFSESPSSRIIPIHQGYTHLSYLEKILKNLHCPKFVEVSHMVNLMEAMHLICKVPNDPEGKVFVAGALRCSMSKGKFTHSKWRANRDRESKQFAYLGRRLQCDRQDITFFTPGIFPRLQVLFHKVFGEIEADVEFGKDVMSICIQGMEIIVECCIAKGEHVIDVMVRAPDMADEGSTLTFVEAKILQTIVKVCAQPVGIQGVKLVEGVIRPDCLYGPSPVKVREDQSVLIQDLVLKLRRQLEAEEPLVYQWKRSEHLKPLATPYVHLLGYTEFEKVLNSYKEFLKWAQKETRDWAHMQKMDKDAQNLMALSTMSASTSARVLNQLGNGDGASTSKAADDSFSPNLTDKLCAVINNDCDCQNVLLPKVNGDETKESIIHHSVAELSLQQGISSELINAEDMSSAQQIADQFSKSMVSSIVQELSKLITPKFEELTAAVHSYHKQVLAMHEEIHQIKEDVLPEVLKTVKQSLFFAVGKEVGKVPRLGFLSPEDGGRRLKMARAIFKDLKNVRIELFCEHREQPHRVEGQKGICVTSIDDGLLKKALPWLGLLLRLLTLVAKVGAHVLAGMGNVIPNVPHLASIIALGFDTSGILDHLYGSGKPSSPSPSPPSVLLVGWQQWLVSELERNHGGTKEHIIYSKFKLRRAIYQDTSFVAWLCPEHYPQPKQPDEESAQLLVPLPLG